MAKLFLLGLLLFTACSPIKYTTIKGKYIVPPFELQTQTNKDAVWDKLIDLFAQKGLSIKIIDRSSGLIISEETRMPWSMEDKNGKLAKQDAFIVVPRRTMAGKAYGYEKVTGEWNVRIKENPIGGTIINVNIVNVRVWDYNNHILSSSPVLTSSVRSTGLFENTIAEYIR